MEGRKINANAVDSQQADDSANLGPSLHDLAHLAKKTGRRAAIARNTEARKERRSNARKRLEKASRRANRRR